MTAASASGPAAVESAQLALMDGFTLRSDGAVRRLSTSAQRVIALVALRGGAISRQRAAFTLWPDATETRAYGSLRTALFRLHAVCPGGSVLESRSEDGEGNALLVWRAEGRVVASSTQTWSHVEGTLTVRERDGATVRTYTGAFTMRRW